MPTTEPEDMTGRTFPLPPEEDGSRHQTKIVELIQESEDELAKDPTMIRFKCRHTLDECEETCAHNDIMEHIKRDETEEGVWHFKTILAHKCPLTKTHKEY